MALIITERNEADRFKEAMRKIEEGYKEIEHLSDKMRIQDGERPATPSQDACTNCPHAGSCPGLCHSAT